MRAFFSVIVVTLLFTFSASDLSAQAITAKVVGTVTDASGAAVPGAGVTIQSVQTNQSRSTKANDVGNYEFSFLPIGSYTLTVEAAGFQKAEVTPFQLSVDQTARVNVQLNVGEVSERGSGEPSSG